MAVPSPGGEGQDEGEPTHHPVQAQIRRRWIDRRFRASVRSSHEGQFTYCVKRFSVVESQLGRLRACNIQRPNISEISSRWIQRARATMSFSAQSSVAAVQIPSSLYTSVAATKRKESTSCRSCSSVSTGFSVSAHVALRVLANICFLMTIFTVGTATSAPMSTRAAFRDLRFRSGPASDAVRGHTRFR